MKYDFMYYDSFTKTNVVTGKKQEVSSLSLDLQSLTEGKVKEIGVRNFIILQVYAAFIKKTGKKPQQKQLVNATGYSRQTIYLGLLELKQMDLI